MGRHSKSEEKRKIILDAFERVILRDGYANASQRKIAKEAGMNQPMIHHYFSGGEEMLEAFLERVVGRYMSALQQFTADDPAPSLEKMIGFLCSKNFHQVSVQNEVFFALIGQGGHNVETFKQMSNIYRFFFREIARYLEQANVNNSDNVAYTMMCMIIGHDWAKKLGFGEQRNSQMVSLLTRLASEN